MRTRSGQKYDDSLQADRQQIKSPPKVAKNAKSKAKSVINENTIEENVRTESKRTRSKPNTESKSKKLAISPKKSPKKPVIAPKKESPKKPVQSPKKTPEKKATVSEKLPEKPVVETRRRPKRGEPIDSPPKPEPKTPKRNTRKAKTESVVEKTIESVDTKEDKTSVSEPKIPSVEEKKEKTEILVKKTEEKETKRPLRKGKTINKTEPIVDSKDDKQSEVEPEVNVDKQKSNKSNDLETKIESKRVVRKTKAPTVVTKKATKTSLRTQSKQTALQKEEKLEEEVKAVEEKTSKASNDKLETETAESPSIKNNEVIEKEQKGEQLAEENKDNEEKAKASEEKLMETQNKEVETVTESDETVDKVDDLMDTTEVTPMEPEVSSVKRKSNEIDSLPSKPEPIKRLKVSHFSVPSIPQICGQLYSFGEEIAGELGPRLKRVDDFKLKTNEPSVVTDKDGLSLDNVVSVVCGAMHSSCLSSEGEVITFGCNDDSALGRDTQTCSDETDDSIDVDESEEREARTPKVVSGIPSVVKMTAGDMHTCALCRDGSVYVWGNFKDESKKLGLFADSPKSETSDDFVATTLPKRLQIEPKVVDIASGCHHILLLTEDGDVLSFGEGSKGQLGRIRDTQLQSIVNDRQLFLNPQKVDFGVGIVVEKVWANHWSSYAKTTSGDIYVFGLNNYHQLGFKSNGSVKVTNSDPNESQTTLNLIIELKPIKVEEMPANVVMIANGQHHMLALDADGRVFSCGSNTYGKLGFKTENSDQTAESPQMISTDAFNGKKVNHIACGEFCSFAVTESGHLMAWGQGSAHIGSEDFTDIEVPTRVKGSLADTTRFVTVSAGSQHSLLIGNKNTINGN